jgi:hypothetical protein
LRKYLVVAFAAITAMAFVTTAVAQTPAPATMKVTIAPKKAGTKKKPKNSSIHLHITNNDNKRTLSKLEITSPTTFKLGGKGLTTCKESTLVAKGPAGCPKASRLGKGTANALVGVNSTTTPPSPLEFQVTPVLVGKNKIDFNLHTDALANDLISPGTIKGRKLTILVPETAQQPLPGTYAGLVDIDTTMKAKKGKHYLASTVGCKSKKHAFSTKLTFIDNGVSPAGTVTVKGTSKCSK